MLAWKTVFAIAVFLAGVGASINKLIPLRHKTRLHDWMVRWWIRLDETPIPDHPRLLAKWITVRFEQAFRVHALRTIVLCVVASGLCLTFAVNCRAAHKPVGWISTNDLIDNGTIIQPVTWFDSIPFPHVTVTFTVLLFDLAMILATIRTLSVIRCGTPFKNLMMMTAHILISVVGGIACFATVLYLEDWAVNHDLIGMQYERRLRMAAEPGLIALNINQNRRWITEKNLQTNPLVIAIQNGQSTNIVVTHYRIVSFFASSGISR